MSELDRLVRSVVTDLAEDARPRDLMPQVRRRARRIRLMHRSGYVAGALLLVAVFLVPYLVVRSRSVPPGTVGPTNRPPSASPAIPTTSADFDGGPIALPGHWTVAAVSSAARNGRDLVLNRDTGRYQRVGYDELWPAPAGSIVAVAQDGGPPGVLDLNTNVVQPITPIREQVLGVQWAPDGSRLLVTSATADHSVFGFTVVNPATGTGTWHQIPMPRCYGQCHFVWLPDGHAVGLNLAGQGATPGGFQRYDADTGQPGQLSRYPGAVAGPQAWSPDGSQVIVGGLNSQYATIVDARTGSPVRDLPSGSYAWATAGDLLSTDRSGGRTRVVIADGYGTPKSAVALPAFLDSDYTVYLTRQ